MIDLDKLGDGTIERCPCCGWTGTRADCGMNPRQGTRVCPICWHHGYDVIPETVPLAKIRPTGEQP